MLIYAHCCAISCIIYPYNSWSFRKINRALSEKFHEYYIKAHIVEVCCESSLQPLLQMYLLFIHFLTQDWINVNFSEIPVQQILQMFSFFSSIIAISTAFASNYCMKKRGEEKIFFHAWQRYSDSDLSTWIGMDANRPRIFPLLWGFSLGCMFLLNKKKLVLWKISA